MKWTRRTLRARAWVLFAVAAGGIAGAARASIPEEDRTLWVTRYNGPSNSNDAAYSVALSPDGSKVFVTGASSANASNSSDYVTTAYSAVDGDELWAARFNGPEDSSDGASFVAASPDGSKVFVTGYSHGGASSYDYATIAYSAASGTQLWVARYNGPANRSDQAHSLAVSPDGFQVFVSGTSYNPDDSTDYETVAYSALDGTQLWDARYNPLNSNDQARSLDVSPDGSKVFVTGVSFGGESANDYATVAYSASSGVQLWDARHDGPASYWDAASSLAVSPDSSKVFVTGRSYGAEEDYGTIAYSTVDGVQLWTARYNGPGHSPVDQADRVAVSPDGSKVLVTGLSDPDQGDADYVTVAYSADDGAQIWVARYNGPDNGWDAPYSLAVSRDGSKVFVTGYSDGSFGTVAYSVATGAKLWAALYKGWVDDRGTSLAVSPDGSKVFVTGYGHGQTGTLYDFITIAYRASSCAGGRDETGIISGPINGVEPSSGLAEPYLHAVNCEVGTISGL